MIRITDTIAIGEDDYTNRCDNAPRNIFSLTGFVLKILKSVAPSEGAPTPALGERSGAPSGLNPSSLVMCNTPVEVQFTSAGCLNYPCRTPIV